MPEFWFIRHGQATHNVGALRDGDMAYFDLVYADAQLTEEGWKQARQAAVPLEPFHAIYCSPLTRCQQTLTASGARGPLFLDDRLMEPQGAHPCNRRAARADIASIVPSTWGLDGVAEQNPYDFGAESPDAFAARVRDATTAIAARHSDSERILIVSHHDWIRTWFHMHLGIGVSPRNAEVVRAVWPAKS